MPRLFVTRDQIGGGMLVVEGDAAHHLAGPLRVQPGEVIQVVDDAGEEHAVRVSSVERARVTGSILWSRPASGEPRLRLDVIQGLVREIDEVVAGLAEVGAAAIHPVVAVRSVTRPDSERAAARLRRWGEIAREAAELAHRGAVPRVAALTNLAGALAELPEGARILVCTVDGAVPLARLDVDAARPAALVIGPEGGLEPGEVDRLREAGSEMVHLGPRVLPARRAAIVAAGLLLARAGDLDHGR
ncbi:MAG: RsmE family RNA methyltransferase [Candidatus Dormibacteria bacterium]